MSSVTIRADHGGVTVDVTISTAGTVPDDYGVVLDRALRAVAVALAPMSGSAPTPTLFDQEATQPLTVDPDADLESSPTEKRAAEERTRRLTEGPFA